MQPATGRCTTSSAEFLAPSCQIWRTWPFNFDRVLANRCPTVTEIEIAVASAVTIAEIAAAAMALFAIAMAPAGSPEWVRAVERARSIAVANPSCARTDSFQSGS
jgi:hypothetical protein